MYIITRYLQLHFCLSSGFKSWMLSSLWRYACWTKTSEIDWPPADTLKSIILPFQELLYMLSDRLLFRNMPFEDGCIKIHWYFRYILGIHWSSAFLSLQMLIASMVPLGLLLFVAITPKYVYENWAQTIRECREWDVYLRMTRMNLTIVVS